jgi:hypothetical protein
MQVRAARLRVATERDVVVAEGGERRPGQDAHEPPEHRLPARMREQIATDRDEVRPPLAGPERRLPGSAYPRRRHPEVEVREMQDPKAVELRRQTAQLELELAAA